MTRESVTVEEVAADPTNCYQVTVNGDAAIESLTIHDGDGGADWVSIRYKNGSTNSGTPKNWHSFVRVTN